MTNQARPWALSLSFFVFEVSGLLHVEFCIRFRGGLCLVLYRLTRFCVRVTQVLLLWFVEKRRDLFTHGQPSKALSLSGLFNKTPGLLRVWRNPSVNLLTPDTKRLCSGPDPRSARGELKHAAFYPERTLAPNQVHAAENTPHSTTLNPKPYILKPTCSKPYTPRAAFQLRKAKLGSRSPIC